MPEYGRYRLAALDMDGTLLNAAHATTPYTRQVLARAAEAGAIVALSTGRCWSELEEHLAAIPGIGYVIGENGAWVYDAHTRRTIWRTVMDDNCVQTLLDLAARYDLAAQCFIDGQSYMDRPMDGTLARYSIDNFVSVFRTSSLYEPNLRALCAAHPGGVGKVNLYFANQADKDAYITLSADADVARADSIGYGLELSPPMATKARGLRELCAALGVDIADAMAVGDGSNDVDIMGAAGLAVAMGNAIPAVKALAHVMTEDCEHDGAAKAIQRYMLGENV